jgi:hypothetical protein
MFDYPNSLLNRTSAVSFSSDNRRSAVFQNTNQEYFQNGCQPDCSASAKWKPVSKNASILAAFVAL